jgi:ribosome biogenesis GTPase / thiamine phosphate phosphatase
MTTLTRYGWNHFHDRFYEQYLTTNLLAGRVTGIKGFKYFLITENGELETELSGKIMFGNSSEDLPQVGDWVLYLDYGAIGYITGLFPRVNALTRKEPGTKSGVQVMASNIDCALVVQGLDRDFNLMRLDRYIVQIAGCGIPAVVILNKSDLVENAEHFVAKVHNLGRKCPVYPCSTLTGTGIAHIKSRVFREGETNILLGSSGAGKSSLLNALMQGPVQRTAGLSDFNQKGKHTTVTRDIFLLDNGSLIIDSPGMREFGLTSAEAASTADLFPVITSLAAQCRFTDCTHLHESGCAVTAALNSGALDATVYASYVKLIREQKRFELSTSDKKRIGKQTGKMIREAKAFRNRFKGG